MYKITIEQKKLLKELASTVQKLAMECEHDNIFNSFMGNLEIFTNDLLETFNIILDNLDNIED